MPSSDFYINAIEEILSEGVTTSYLTASAANDVYEGLVFSIVVAAARDAGARIGFYDTNGDAVKNLLFRTSPGNIYSTAQKYTYAKIDFDAVPTLEIHIGVFVSGRSGVLHECDVAVIDHSESEICRRERVHPRNSKTLIALECKFHASTLQLGHGRAYLGLLEELTKKQRFLVTNTSSDASEKMINYHDAEREFGLDDPNSQISKSLQSSLSRIFRNYIVKQK